MIFRRLRKFLKPRLKRYPMAFRLYEAISWTFTRSHVALQVKRFFPTMGNIVFPMWLGPRYKLARRYAVEGELDKAMRIADDPANSTFVSPGFIGLVLSCGCKVGTKTPIASSRVWRSAVSRSRGNCSMTAWVFVFFQSVILHL
jgi:hypothetical protein